MTDREKLVGLLESTESAFYWSSADKSFVEKIADHLITNGVTFAKDTNVPSWIPVSERLPGIFEPVIVWTKFKEIGEAHYNGKRFQWIDDEGDYDYAYVTHWMPLPEPPREDTVKP